MKICYVSDTLPFPLSIFCSASSSCGPTSASHLNFPSASRLFLSHFEWLFLFFKDIFFKPCSERQESITKPYKHITIITAKCNLSFFLFPLEHLSNIFLYFILMWSYFSVCHFPFSIPFLPFHLMPFSCNHLHFHIKLKLLWK